MISPQKIYKQKTMKTTGKNEIEGYFKFKTSRDNDMYIFLIQIYLSLVEIRKEYLMRVCSKEP